MTNKKHYQMVDHSIVFFDHETETIADEIRARLEEIFKGVRFHNTCTGEWEAADNVTLEPFISERDGSFFLMVGANLKMDVPYDLKVYFNEGETTLQYIEGRFVHVKEFPFYSGLGTHVEMLLPGETKSSTSFHEYVLKNL